MKTSRFHSLFAEIAASTPTLRLGHGSTRYGKCNNPACEINRGSDDHRWDTEGFTALCQKRHKEILNAQS